MPHSFRIYSSPYYVRPQSTHWKTYMITSWTDEDFVTRFRVIRGFFMQLCDMLHIVLAGAARSLTKAAIEIFAYRAINLVRGID